MISFKKNKREEREECRYLELTFLSLLNDHKSETSAMIYSLVYYARKGVTFETSLKFVFSMRLSSQIRCKYRIISDAFIYVYLYCFFTKLLTLLIHCRSNATLY